MVIAISSRSTTTTATTTTALCTLAAVVALSCSLLAFKTFARDSNHNLNHPSPSPPPPFFSAAPYNSHSHKDSHPTNCVLHKSGVYLAVTSIGHGFPRVQFTCTLAHQHPYPTASLTPAQVQHRSHPLNGKSEASVAPQNRVHDPAEPAPEQTPHLLSIYQEKETEEQVKEEGGSTIYSDLHLTHSHREQQQRQQPARSVHPTDRKDSPSHRKVHSLPKYGYIFSPREGSLQEAEIHTITQTYTEDGEHPEKRSIHLTEMKETNHASAHHYLAGSVPPVSVGIHQYGDNNEWQITAKPEPMATLLEPTMSAKGGCSRNVYNGERVLLSHKCEQKVGPPSPTPEPFPAQATGASIHLQQQHQEEEDHHHGRPKKQHQHLDSSEGNHDKVHKVVRRVTTLIIETKTIIAPQHPAPTATQFVSVTAL